MENAGTPCVFFMPECAGFSEFVGFEKKALLKSLAEYLFLKLHFSNYRTNFA